MLRESTHLLLGNIESHRGTGCNPHGYLIWLCNTCYLIGHRYSRAGGGIRFHLDSTSQPPGNSSVVHAHSSGHLALGLAFTDQAQHLGHEGFTLGGSFAGTTF